MPELPEVETIARDIRPHLAGRTITAARVFKTDILKNSTRPRFERGVTGRKILAVSRRAKNLVLVLDDDRRIVIQPGMTGAMLVERPRTTHHAPRTTYDVIRLSLSSGKFAVYQDVRRLGRVYLFTPAQWAKHDAAIGPEPLDPAFSAGAFHAILKGSRLAIKKAIMDQRKLAGVGNIYANEALWVAGIDPSREARRIRPEESALLHGAIVRILADSIEGRGTTVRDYRTGTGEPGNFQGRLVVYERAGEPCLRCGRRIAQTHAIDARSSYFCPGCQR